MGKAITKNKLTAKQEKFCQIYARNKDCFGNGVQSFYKAFPKNKIKYNSVKTEAYRMLTNPLLVERIRELIDIYISDEVADKELGTVILQYANLPSKVAAIREYNKVKGRLAPTQIKFVDDNEDMSDADLEAMLKKKSVESKS